MNLTIKKIAISITPKAINVNPSTFFFLRKNHNASPKNNKEKINN
jgi:hypothetical protein